MIEKIAPLAADAVEGLTTKVMTHCKYNENQRETQDVPDVVRVGDRFLVRVTRYDISGRPYETYEARRRETIGDLYGKEFLKKVSTYEAAVIVPNHINYQQVIGNCWNLYHELDYKPASGKHDHWDKLVSHIFGDKAHLGWDYLTLAYREPTQKLPVLILASEENGTGKTTFGNALTFLFGRNAGFYTQDDLSSSFNSWMKSLFAIFEEISDAKHTLNKLKAMSTAREATLNEKYMAQTPFQPFVKIIILSNNVKDVIKANENDKRYWIVKVPPLNKDEFLPDFNERLRDEVPAVMNTLATRELSVPCRSRMWFDEELLKTDALATVIENTQSDAAKEIRLWVADILEQRPNGFGVNLSELYLALGGKFKRTELRTALKEELKIESSRTSYINHEGNRNNGQAFMFKRQAGPEPHEDLPF